MPDPKSAQSSSTAKESSPASETKAPAKASLAQAAESADPDVHRLLAERQAAALNLAEATYDAAAKAKADKAKAQLAEVDKQLADLGVTAV